MRLSAVWTVDKIQPLNQTVETMNVRECKTQELRDGDLIHGIAAMQITGGDVRRITAEDLWHLGDPLKSLLAQGRVFAVQQDDLNKRIARITLDGTHLYLHVLRDGSLPFGAYVVEHKEAMKLVYPSSRLTFIELGLNGTTLGRISIRLSPDSQAAKQFSALCTGEVGFSYLNTSLIHVWEKDCKKEYVQFGDYEVNDGSGGRALLPGLGDGEEYNREWVAGTVWGFLSSAHVAAQFYIMTRTNPGQVVCTPSFGMVESGLNVLKEAVRCCGNIRQTFIADCGVVLSTAFSP